MILALLVTQLVAVPCSILFSRLAVKFGAMRMILSRCVCTLICIVAIIWAIQ
jgi:UMF1 family MFS transporter